MRWYRFGADFFVCDCEKRKMYWMYIQFFGKKQAGKDVPKVCRRINQRFPKIQHVSMCQFHSPPAEWKLKFLIIIRKFGKTSCAKA